MMQQTAAGAASDCTATVATAAPGVLDYLGAYSGVVGTVLALAAFLYSLAQARKAEAAALQQRQLQFELGLLAEATRQFALTGTYAHIVGYLRALRASSKAPNELLVARAAASVESSPAGETRLAQLRRAAAAAATDNHQARQAAETAVAAAVTQELSETIQARLR